MPVKKPIKRYTLDNSWNVKNYDLDTKYVQKKYSKAYELIYKGHNGKDLF